MISITEIRQAVLRRFVPTISVLLGGIMFMIAFREPGGLHWQGLAVAGLEVVAMTIGYASGMSILRRWVASGVRIDGWRSVLAGVMAPIGLGAISAFTQGATISSIAVLSVGAGALSALATLVVSFRSPSPPKRSLDELEAEADAEITRLESLPGPSLVSDIVPGREKERPKFRHRVA